MELGQTCPRIIIVDDEALHLRALKDALGQKDFLTSATTSPEQALAWLATERFDLLLADLAMPGMDGIALIDAARQIDSDLACVIMTGEGSVTSAVEAMKIGAADYVTKPIKISVLQQVLSRALQARTLKRDNRQLEERLREKIDELSVANRALEQARIDADSANRAKSTFLANISHELRTPLNTILGFSQVLVTDAGEVPLEALREYSGHIYQSGKHLLSLINEILDLAKIESGVMAMSIEAVHLADVFAQCATMIERQAARRNISVRFPLDCDVLIKADHTRVTQVLINLLTNAIKYNREWGTVAVKVLPVEGQRVRIAVADSGAGLSEEQLSVIFQPFNRLGREMIDEDGTGIGLALTKRLVEAMNGEILIESTPGVGSTFSVEFESVTQKRPPLPAEFADHPDAGAARLAGKRVLYVEDNPANLQLVRELLRLKFGMSLLAATTAQEGLAQAREQVPDLILMDINLPGMDGIDAYGRLQSDPLTAHIPVIALTANVMPGEAKKIKAAGFRAYIAKPIDIGLFTRAVCAALDQDIPAVSSG